MATVLRVCATVVGLLLFLVGPPLALAYVVGWPLPSSWPTASKVIDWLSQPTLITVDGLIKVGACVLWLLWAMLALGTLAELVTAVTRWRLPRIPLPAALRGVVTGLIASVTVVVNSSAVQAASSPPLAPVAQPAHPRQGAGLPAIPRPRVAEPTAIVQKDDRDGRLPVWARDSPGGVHRVVRGDTLWDLAAAKLDDPRRWREIYTLNKGRRQANGYALTDPDTLHVGWTLALPARHRPTTPPAPPRPEPPTTKTDPAPAEPHTDPTPPPDGSGTDADTPAATATGPTALPSSPAVDDNAATDTPEQQNDASPTPGDRHGVYLPSRAWISLGLAAAIAAIAALLRLQQRRRARLTFPTPATTTPHPTPVPPSLAPIDTIGSRHLQSTADTHRLPSSTVPAPIGVNSNGTQVSLFHLPSPGVALHGDGAISAARAILAAVLTTGAAETSVTRPVIVTTADLLAKLLPEGAPTVGLDPDGTTYDGERLIVLADTAAAVTHAEEEMIGRRRLLDTFDAATITDLNTRTDHAETQPPYVLLIEATSRHTARLHAVASHRATLDLHPVVLGHHDDIPTLEITAQGAVTGGEPRPVARLSTLSPDDLAAILTMLTDAMARPEAGTDIDNPPTETPPPPAAATTEATEPTPVQPHDTATLVRLRVLGPVTVTTDTGPIATGMRSSSYTVLAVLAAHPAGRTLDQLAADLYPDIDPTAAVKRIRTAITSARRVLRTATGHHEPMFIGYNPATGRYQLDPQTVTVDLWQMLTAINHATTTDDDTATLAALRQATDLYAGDFAEGVDHTWATDYATSYRHHNLAAYARIAEILETDHPDQAIAALERATDLDPINDELYQRIMRIHGRQQRPDAVRRTLRRLEERLTDLGDTEPSQATRRVAERQLRPAAPDPRGRP
ncbi:BTAD domain-containing putative transcriptional regulator [Rhizomonospora bruguierae]|uniref:BTAD domain-containing putative transcriptional regulator n=1 Tax=Rhizomonospora bruguierae TaxID=1581705 RepID=UPI0020BD7047|nr:BTAD domain-containing putative transcriptional regulator [Micromonospora sp. NBRC 107566]